MKITRYTPMIHGPKTGLAMERAMVEDPNGKWVNFDECMKEFIKSLSDIFIRMGKEFYQVIEEEEEEK